MIKRGLKSTRWVLFLLLALGINTALYLAMSKLSHQQENNLQKKYEKPILLTMPEERPQAEKKKRRRLKKKRLETKKLEIAQTKKSKTVPPPKFEFSKGGTGFTVNANFATAITHTIPSFAAPKTLFDLGELDQKPRLLHQVPPVYPYAAKRRNVTGSIKLQFIVDNLGNVGQITILKAEPAGIFEESAIRAVEKWRFKPGVFQGEAVSTRVVVPINFKI